VSVDEFIEKLAEYEDSDTVFNMYRGDSAAAKKCRENLKKYLEKHKDTQILLVGEAPGYKGCARTGVPFTSDSGEISSKVLQGAINKYSHNVDVLIWNAFPFHPHKEDNLKSNRKPNKAELQIGQMFLKDFLEVFPNIKCVASVGKVAQGLLKKFEFEYEPDHIRHPSYGHKKECEEDTYGALFRFFLMLNDERIMKEVASYAGKKYEDAAYQYLKEHKDEFFRWYNASDHIAYAHAYWALHEDIDLFEYRKKLKISK
jgi:uracil-DNA glycosylase family 4